MRPAHICDDSLRDVVYDVVLVFQGQWLSGGDDIVPEAQERLVLSLQGVINANVQETILSNVRVSLLVSGNVTDALGITRVAPSAASLLPVTGSWGEASQPDIRQPNGVTAVNYGGQEGLGVGDAIIVQFNQPVRQVPIAGKAAMDALLEFSAPGWARNYSGTWLSVTTLMITVSAAGANIHAGAARTRIIRVDTSMRD